jgi:hypothetical protein
MSRPKTRLMIIGYGIRDPHITAAITKAADAGLRVFILEKKGANLAKSLNSTRPHGRIPLQPS